MIALLLTKPLNVKITDRHYGNASKNIGREDLEHIFQAKSTDREAMISLHVFVTDFVAVISSQSEGLGKMALGIVKIYFGPPFSANRRCSRSVCSWSVCRGQLPWTHIFRF